MSDPAVQDALFLLAAEKTAITCGDYPALDQLAPRKSALFARLDKAVLTPVEARALAACLAQNQRLLAAAVQGIKAAQDRLAALRQVRDGLQVYDQTGQFTCPAIHRPDLVKRA